MKPLTPTAQVFSVRILEKYRPGQRLYREFPILFFLLASRTEIFPWVYYVNPRYYFNLHLAVPGGKGKEGRNSAAGRYDSHEIPGIPAIPGIHRTNMTHRTYNTYNNYRSYEALPGNCLFLRQGFLQRAGSSSEVGATPFGHYWTVAAALSMHITHPLYRVHSLQPTLPGLTTPAAHITHPRYLMHLMHPPHSLQPTLSGLTTHITHSTHSTPGKHSSHTGKPAEPRFFAISRHALQPKPPTPMIFTIPGQSIFTAQFIHSVPATHSTPAAPSTYSIDPAPLVSFKSFPVSRHRHFAHFTPEIPGFLVFPALQRNSTTGGEFRRETHDFRGSRGRNKIHDTHDTHESREIHDIHDFYESQEFHRSYESYKTHMSYMTNMTYRTNMTYISGQSGQPGQEYVFQQPALDYLKPFQAPPGALSGDPGEKPTAPGNLTAGITSGTGPAAGSAMPVFASPGKPGNSQPQPPGFNLDRLTDQVYRALERKLKTEKERRGW